MSRVVLRGRSEEIAAGLGLLRRTRQSGHGAVLLIEGPPGIGKSAILAELVAQAAQLGFRCGLSKADQITGTSPATPVLLALRSGASPLLSAAELKRLGDCAGSPLVLLDELTAVLEHEAAAGPILIGVDDTQWVDAASRLMLRSAPPRLSGVPVVWVFTARHATDGLVHDLRQQPFAKLPVQGIALEPLVADDIMAIARDRLRHPPSESLRRLLGGAGGNPFFVNQILDGVMRTSGDDDQLDIPAEFILSVRRRIAELDPTAGELARVTAVFGKPLTVEDIEALLPDLPHVAVVRSLEDLEHAGLLRTQGPGRITFAHDLVRDAVYADLTDRTRRAFHHRCALYLEEVADDSATAAAHAKAAITPGDESIAELLLRSVERLVGAMPETAADLVLTAFHALRPEQPLWRTAGLRSVELLGLVQRCDEAIKVAEVLLSQTDEADACGEIEIVAARTLWLLHQWDWAVERSARALRRRGLSESMRTRLAALHALARSRVEPADAVRPEAERALAAAERISDPDGTVLARHAVAEVARNRGDHLASLRHYRELRVISGPTYVGQEIQSLQHLDRFTDAGVILRQARRDLGLDRSLVFVSIIYAQIWWDYHLGHLDDAEAGARTLLDLALGRRSYFCGIDATSLLSLVALQRGDVALARERLVGGFGPLPPDVERRVPSRLLVRGWVTAAEGDVTQAVDLLRPLLIDGRNHRDPWPWQAGWLQMLAHLGLTARDSSFTDEVVTLAEIGARRNPDVPSLVGAALHLRGLVRHDVELLDEAVRVLHASPRPLVRAGAEQDLGFEFVAQGRRHDGAQHLDAAWRTYREIGAFGPMTELQDGMRRVGFRRSHWQATQPRPTGGWAALTPAEAKVARLIATGYTNKAAGQQLGISPNTVGTHLRAAFRKLDVRSRVQLSNLIHDLGTDAG
jgi:DNA-binding CsgD family transcriptional regulator